MKPLGPVPAGFSADDKGELLIGGQPASSLAEASTPLFAYDRARIGAKIAGFRAAMPDVDLHYAVKANPYGLLLEYMAALVDGFDVASHKELERVAGLGLPVSFAGPGKGLPALEAAIRAGVTINVESEGEAERALAIASRLGMTASLAVRVNPPFGLKGAGMRMGGHASPFGVDHDRVPALVKRIVAGGAHWRGLHIYAGSQSLSTEALSELQQQAVDLAGQVCEAAGAAPRLVNLGGGIGIPYFAKDEPVDLPRLGEALGKALNNRAEILRDTRFALELGRWLVGEAGVYLTRVVDRKVSRGRTFLVTDGGLQHVLAASGNFGQLLRRNYPVAVANRFGAPASEEVTIVGCLCTPLDLLADEAMLPRADVGDLIAIFCTGAYGLSASPIGFLDQPAAREMLL